MTVYLVTFYSHFGAIRFKKRCDARAFPARLMPVPRSLSSSCGICVRFETDEPIPNEFISEDVERIVEPNEAGYQERYRAEFS